PLKFFQWDNGQPVNDESNKNYAAFSPAVRKERWGNYYGTACNNQTPGENTYGFICEWENAEYANRSLKPEPATPVTAPVMIPAAQQAMPSTSTKSTPENLFMRAERRKKVTARYKQDRKRYNETEMKEIEELYQVANKQFYSQNAQESLKKLVSKYPHANRTGCALLYLGQMCPNRPQAEEYLRQAIANYSDCWYGNGVQVGAYARFCLAGYYRQRGRTQDAGKLYQEIREKYPDAVTHNGKPLADCIPK
ncbi:MAG: hypothetical protein WC071_07615, partial [Victivallaceae bacterium]